MVIKIDPIFTDFGITYKEKLPKDVVDIPVDHPAYKDIWRRIDNYTDKYFLAAKFEEAEGEDHSTILESLLELDEEIDLFKKIAHHWETFTPPEKMPLTPIKKKYFFLTEIYKISDKLTESHVECFNMNPYYSREECQRELEIIKGKIENRFSNAIRKKYPFECNPVNRVELELETQADLIIKDQNAIRDNFQEMKINTKTKPLTFETNSMNEKIIKLNVCQILEKHFGLRYNPKNGIYYISNGEGMFVPFDETNLDITYASLRDKFVVIQKKRKGRCGSRISHG